MRRVSCRLRVANRATSTTPGSISTRGFTLLELIIVMMILGVMVALAIPSFVKFYKQQESQQMVATISRVFRFAQQESILKREVRTVGIDFEQNAYFIKADPLPGDYRSEIRMRHKTRLPKGFEFKSLLYVWQEKEERSERGFFSFYPNGTADKVKLVIRQFNPETGRTRNHFVLRTNDLTGRVNVWEKKDDKDSFY